MTSVMYVKPDANGQYTAIQLQQLERNLETTIGQRLNMSFAMKTPMRRMAGAQASGGASLG